MKTEPWTKPDQGDRRPVYNMAPTSSFLDHLALGPSSKNRPAASRSAAPDAGSNDRRIAQSQGSKSPESSKVPSEVDGQIHNSVGPSRVAELDSQVPGSLPHADASELNSGQLADLENKITTTAGSAFSFLSFGMFAPDRGIFSGQTEISDPKGVTIAAPSPDLAIHLIQASEAQMKLGRFPQMALDVDPPQIAGQEQAPEQNGAIARTSGQTPTVGEAAKVSDFDQTGDAPLNLGRSSAPQPQAAKVKPQGQVQLLLSQVDGRFSLVAAAPGLSAAQADQLHARAKDLIQSTGEVLGELQLNGRAVTGGTSRIHGGRNGPGAN